MVDQLPIAPFLNQIVKSKGRYKLVDARTGAGKSTEVPPRFEEEGYCVLVAMPLIETVIGTAEYVAEKLGVKLGGKVGYRTGKYHCDSSETRILFCTTELALIRQICGHNKKFKILIIDEFHEGRLDQETLEAFAWKGIQDGTGNFEQVVILSATMDHDGLSKMRGNAPIFRVPGRQFPIKDLPKGKDIPSDIRMLVAKGWDVLTFVSGKGDIKQLINALQGLDCELIPFHGQLSREEKDLAYRSYNRPKVVISTDALETGRTLLPSKGRQLAVVDSGMANIIKLVKGVEALYPTAIALSRGMQRRGRGGRVSPSVYIDHCPVPRENRQEYPDPEIFRVRLDSIVLKLAEHNFDMEDLPFFHKPKSETIRQSKNTLRALGGLDNGIVTDLGREIIRMPISPQNARMVIEAKRLGVVDDVISIAAILEIGEVTARNTKHYPRWRNLVGREDQSDVMAQLAVFKAARTMTPDEMRENDIHVSNYFKILEVRKQIAESIRHRFGESSTGEREDILTAVCAGMVDNLYERKPDSQELSNGSGVDRTIVFDSLVQEGDWFVGLPHDQVSKSTWGAPKVKHQLRMVTRVNPVILAEVAPKLARSQDLTPHIWDESRGNTFCQRRIFFRNRQVFEGEVVVTTPEARAKRADWLAEKAWDAFEPLAIDGPDIMDIEAGLPGMRTHQYGVHALKGAPLKAYGVLEAAFTTGGELTSFAARWRRDRKVAEAALAQSVLQLNRFKVQRLHALSLRAHQAFGGKLKTNGAQLKKLADTAPPLQASEKAASKWIGETLRLLYKVDEEIARYQTEKQRNAFLKLFSIFRSKPVPTELSSEPGSARQAIARLEDKLPTVEPEVVEHSIDTRARPAKRLKRA